MRQTCVHGDVQIHAFIELQVPYFLKQGAIVTSSIDDTPVIRPDMGATCQQCDAFAVYYPDWRKAPDELLTLSAQVRKDMQEASGYIEGYPP